MTMFEIRKMIRKSNYQLYVCSEFPFQDRFQCPFALLNKKTKKGTFYDSNCLFSHFDYTQAEGIKTEVNEGTFFPVPKCSFWEIIGTRGL